MERCRAIRNPSDAGSDKNSVLLDYAPVLRKLIDRLNARFAMHLEVVAVENNYFGGDVSVAGLLTGQDFIAARNRVSGEFAIIPRVALKGDEPVMLDGMRFEEVRTGFDMPLYAFDFTSLARLLTDGNASIAEESM